MKRAYKFATHADQLYFSLQNCNATKLYKRRSRRAMKNPTSYRIDVRVAEWKEAIFRGVF